MKEQIEELWNIITTDCDGKCVGCEFENNDWCFTHHAARAIYNAGYRKQKEGEWVYRENEFGNAYYACSICDCQTRYKENYCSSCGAKMKGENDE